MRTAIGAAIALATLATEAPAQSLKYLCDPAAATFNQKECDRQTFFKTEMMKCIIGGTNTGRAPELVARLCETRFVPEAIRRAEEEKAR